MHFFRSKAPFESPEILSVHIPKTAGVTFLQTLERVYGRNLMKVYSHKMLEKINQLTLNSLPGKTLALHGHFELSPGLRTIFPAAKIICWLRDPVDRVISHYNYWLHYPAHGNAVHDRFLREKPDLINFATEDFYSGSVRAYRTHLGGLKPSEIYFAGRVEHYQEDLILLAKLMNWPVTDLEMDRHNPGPTQRTPVSKTMRSELEQIIAEEYELYRSLVR